MKHKRENMRFIRDQLEAGAEPRTVVWEYNRKFFGGQSALSIGELNRIADTFKDAKPRATLSNCRTNRCGIFGDK